MSGTDPLNLVGRTLGSYEVVRLLGVGGMAYVYEGRHRALGRRVAIKVARRELCEADGTFLERFEREARTAATLNHRHIVNVHDVGEEGGLHYFVMDYVEGEDLASKIRREGRIPLAQALEWARQVGEALDYAHAQGFIHRDIKPQNILIGGDGEARVTDFGIARAIEGTRLSRSGATIGTAEYMSPEQAGGLPVDHRTDIYSLGVVVYEMLSGRVPFTGTNPVAIATQHLNVAPPPLSGLVSLPEGVERAVLRALAKDPRERYDTCAEFVRALAEGETTQATGAPLLQPSAAPRPAAAYVQPRRNYAAFALVPAILLLIALGAYLLLPRPPPGAGLAEPPVPPTGTGGKGGNPPPPPPEHMIADSGSRLLTEADLAPLTAWQLDKARNEIYARHGRPFVRADLQQYFGQKSWYRVDPSYTDSRLSEIEKKNAVFIISYEKRMGYK